MALAQTVSGKSGAQDQHPGRMPRMTPPPRTAPAYNRTQLLLNNFASFSNFYPSSTV